MCNKRCPHQQQLRGTSAFDQETRSAGNLPVVNFSMMNGPVVEDSSCSKEPNLTQSVDGA
jgi:hypothetical protein